MHWSSPVSIVKQNTWPSSRERNGCREGSNIDGTPANPAANRQERSGKKGVYFSSIMALCIAQRWRSAAAAGEVVVNVAIHGPGPWLAAVGGLKPTLEAVFQFTLPADDDRRP